MRKDYKREYDKRTRKFEPHLLINIVEIPEKDQNQKTKNIPKTKPQKRTKKIEIQESDSLVPVYRAERPYNQRFYPGNGILLQPKSKTDKKGVE